MVRKRDRFWQYAEDLGGRFKCIHCKRNFSGGIPRVKSHLSGIKGLGIDVCSSVPKEVQREAFEAINGSKPIKKLKTTSSSSDDNVSADNRMQKESSSLDDLLAKFVLVNGLDLGAIQDSTFLDFIDALTKHGPGYKIPSYWMFKTNLFPNLTMKVEDYVKSVKKSWDKSGCTIIETCSNAEDKIFAIITAYSPEGPVFLGSFEIPKGDLTSCRLEDLAHSVVKRLGPENVVQYIAGSAEIEQPPKIMKIGEHCVFRTQCAENKLQCLFKDIYENVEWVGRMIDKARQVVAHIHKHTAILSLLRQFTNNQELKQAVPNKFSSNFDMYRSIIKFKKELLLLVSSLQWTALNDVDEETGKQVTEIIQGGEFWPDGEEALPLFESLLQVVQLADSYDSNFCYLYGAMKMAEVPLIHLHTCHPEKYKRIREIFFGRQRNIIHPIHAVAAFLNPAYMYSEKFSDSDKIREGIDFLMVNFISVEDREAFLTQMLRYRKKLPDLFTCLAVTMLKTSHPYEWWDYCGDSVPVLKKYAFKILSQPCSTSSIKGCMNGLQNVQTMVPWGSRPAGVGNHLYLRMNALFMEKFRAVKTQIRKPIDIENIDKLPDHTFSEDYCLDLMDGSLKQSPLSELESSWFRLTEKSASQGKVLQLQFKTDISSRVLMRDKVTGEHGPSIHVVLVDSETGNTWQAGSESMIKLTIVVLEGGFAPEATGDWTPEEFESSVIMGRNGGRPILIGDLEVILNLGVGTVGALTFDDDSSWTASGKFRLGLKATTRCHPSIRIREGISNAFIVEKRDYGNDLSSSVGREVQDPMAERIEHFDPALFKEPQSTSILVEAILKKVQENLTEAVQSIFGIQHICGCSDTVTIKSKERIRFSNEPKDKQRECCSANPETREPHTFSHMNQGCLSLMVGDSLNHVQATNNNCVAGMSSSTPACSQASAPGNMHEQGKGRNLLQIYNDCKQQVENDGAWAMIDAIPVTKPRRAPERDLLSLIPQETIWELQSDNGIAVEATNNITSSSSSRSLSLWSFNS